ncbi:MAG: hypothetical protein JWR75_1455 [Devosia sp.]|nr:hypothetical protein [Devosia sp.]
MAVTLDLPETQERVQASSRGECILMIQVKIDSWVKTKR